MGACLYTTQLAVLLDRRSFWLLSIVKSEHVWLVEHETDMLTLAMAIDYQAS